MPIIKPTIEYNPDHYRFRRRLEPWEQIEGSKPPWHQRNSTAWILCIVLVIMIAALAFMGDGAHALTGGPK